MTRKQTVAQAIATALVAHLNCERDINSGGFPAHLVTLRETWSQRWRDRIESLCENCLPHGSGFDSGVTLDMGASKARKLVFTAQYHPMNESGYYESWVEARVIVRPDFEGFDVTARGAGSDHNDYIAEAIAEALGAEAPPLVMESEA